VAHAVIHAPDPQGDPRNIHAHVLVSLRKIGPEGFSRTKAEQQERYRKRGAFVDELREKWETLANRHLARNGIAARIDRRSLEDQGSTREPEQHRGPAVTAMQRRGQVKRIEPELSEHQAVLAAQEPPAAPEAAALIPAPAQAAEPSTFAKASADGSCAPGRGDDVEIVPPPLPAAEPPEPEPQIFRGEYSCAIDTAPVMVPRAIANEIPDQSPGGDVVTEPRGPPQTLGGAIKSVFRAAVKSVLRRAETTTQPKQRKRKGETGGEFRRLARNVSRRFDVRRSFRARASITSRFLAIPAEVYAMATAYLSDTLNSLTDDIGDDAENLNAVSEHISPQP
jgi:MobA/MobL family